jgi:hypothetical protein
VACGCSCIIPSGVEATPSKFCQKRKIPPPSSLDGRVGRRSPSEARNTLANCKLNARIAKAVCADHERKAPHDPGGNSGWLEPQADATPALRFSVWRDGAWSEPTTVAAAQPFSRHPSESPGVVALSDRNLIAYWSQKSPKEKTPTQEVDVYFSVSTDRGLHWTSPIMANRPGTGEENSYPSAAPLDDKRAALIWLDGANWTKQKRVALMSRTVHSDGSATEATVIDPDTCTCCPTSLVRAGSGLVAAYRGHTPENIRDISLLRNVDGRWSQPHVAHADDWHFARCPVNGPHLDADRKQTVIAWFTGAQDQPAVNLAFSIDGGNQFLRSNTRR